MEHVQCTGATTERLVLLLVHVVQEAKDSDLCCFGLGVARAGVEQVQDSLLDALSLV